MLDSLAKDRGEKHSISNSIEGERAQKQFKRLRLYTVTFTIDLATLPGTGVQFPNAILFPGGIHLPNESELGSAWIENHGTATTLTIVEGPQNSGRVIGTVPFGKYRVVTFADNISSFQVISSVTDSGLVIVNAYSHQHGPKTGTL